MMEKPHCIYSISINFSYEKGGVSNMAIAEVKMPTGWVPVSSTLDEVNIKYREPCADWFLLNFTLLKH